MKIIMMIGIPGCGKSTMVKRLIGQAAYRVVCPDDIRAEVGKNYADQSVNKRVFALVDERIKDAISKGENVIYDATNCTEWRKETVKELLSWGAESVDAFVFNTDIDICKERNSKREFPVPNEVIDRMYSSLLHNPVDVNDGFSKIVYVR